jgi:hypothetical protein
MEKSMEPKILTEIVYCPICHEKIDVAFEGNTNEPFVSLDNYFGLIVWGPYSAPKVVKWNSRGWVHFVIGDEERVVKLK